MDASFPSLSAVTASWLVACPWALVRGGLGRPGHGRRPAAILLQTVTRNSPRAGLMDGAA